MYVCARRIRWRMCLKTLFLIGFVTDVIPSIMTMLAMAIFHRRRKKIDAKFQKTIGGTANSILKPSMYPINAWLSKGKLIKVKKKLYDIDKME